MGGEFFLRVKDEEAFKKIDPLRWQEVMKALKDKFEPELKSCELLHYAFDAEDKAFEFVDKGAQSSLGQHKAFSFPKILDHSLPDGGIGNGLGGRRRTDFSQVGRVIVFVCQAFPNVFQLNVCDGIGGYHDDGGPQGDWCYTGGAGMLAHQLVCPEWEPGAPLGSVESLLGCRL